MDIEKELLTMTVMHRAFPYRGEVFKGHDMGPVEVVVTRAGTGKKPEWFAQFCWADVFKQTVKYTMIERLVDAIILFTEDDD